MGCRPYGWSLLGQSPQMLRDSLRKDPGGLGSREPWAGIGAHSRVEAPWNMEAPVSGFQSVITMAGGEETPL